MHAQQYELSGKLNLSHPVLLSKRAVGLNMTILMILTQFIKSNMLLAADVTFDISCKKTLDSINQS